MKNSRYIRRNRRKLILGFFVVIGLLSFVNFMPHAFQQELEKPTRLWQIQSIDTMKTSRDKARVELHNSEFDKKIKKELVLIKATGANYVTLGTPYDEEFEPYLKRWIKYAREAGLHVWFRGNWSSWEGWFEYPKNLSPEEHIEKTYNFIIKNPDLFEDGDIFEACPECENAEHWEQPEENKEYNAFLQKQQASNKAAFAKIEKDVKTNIVSIIGGRAKEVLTKKTIRQHDNVVSIDHYVYAPEGMREYIDYFKNQMNAKVVISEFGAPIPDRNGQMDETEQAEFIKSIFEEFYKGGDTVIGVNYYVSIHGTTPILNDDYTKRKAYDVVKNYFTPAIVKGHVKNPLGDPLVNVKIKTADGIHEVITDKNGNYQFLIPPPRESKLIAEKQDFTSDIQTVTIKKSDNEITVDFVIEPEDPDIFYKSRRFFLELIR